MSCWATARAPHGRSHQVKHPPRQTQLSGHASVAALSLAPDGAHWVWIGGQKRKGELTRAIDGSPAAIAPAAAAADSAATPWREQQRRPPSATEAFVVAVDADDGPFEWEQQEAYGAASATAVRVDDDESQLSPPVQPSPVD